MPYQSCIEEIEVDLKIYIRRQISLKTEEISGFLFDLPDLEILDFEKLLSDAYMGV